MSEKKTVDARYISESGIYFDHQAPWPHENFVTLKWEEEKQEDDIIIEFVFFGSYQNKSIYHDVRIEDKTTSLT